MGENERRLKVTPVIAVAILTHRQRRRHMTYKRSSVNNNNLKAAKRKENVFHDVFLMFSSASTSTQAPEVRWMNEEITVMSPIFLIATFCLIKAG